MVDKFEIKQRIRELVNIIYSKYSCVGGALHIILDDHNIEDEHIKFCLIESIPKIYDDEERQVYTECAELLLKLSYSSRSRLLKNIKK